MRVLRTLGRAWLGVAAALFAALAGAAPAAAEDWRLIGETTNGDAWYVDAESVRAEGPAVYAWTKVVHKASQPSKIKNWARYDYYVAYERNDCAARSFAIQTVLERRNNGEIVGTYNAPPEKRDAMLPHVDGTVGARASQFICQEHDRQAALKPAVDLQGIKSSDWVLAGPDAGGEISLAYLPSSVVSEDGWTSVVVRADHAAPKRLPDGVAYTRVIYDVAFDCERGRSGTTSLDFYDAGGRLVSSLLATGDDFKPKALEKGSMLYTLGARICTTAAEQDSGAAGQGGRIGTGTGWLAEGGYIVTASHVVGEARVVEIYQEGRPLGRAEVVRNDPANDVAVLKPLFSTADRAALRVSSRPAALGSRVFTLGYPIGGELGFESVKMTAGDVSSLAGVDVATGRPDDRRFLQVSIPIQRGNSGGPVIDADGAVVGVVTSKKSLTADDEIIQNVNFALKAAYVGTLMADLTPLPGGVAVKPAADTAGLVAQIQSGVFLVVVR